MPTHLILLRGINVGRPQPDPHGRPAYASLNRRIPVGDDLHCERERDTALALVAIEGARVEVERLLTEHFRLDAGQLRVHVLSHAQVQAGPRVIYSRRLSAERT